jgi:CRISPR-associated protein (TIGR03985 family)
MRPQFTFLPTVGFLQLLAPVSLKQNLPKALRLWVILRSLYGADNDEVKLNLRELFSYEEWRSQFFTQADSLNKENRSEKIYHKRDEIPPLHDINCRCAKTLSDWLFDENLSLSICREKWQDSFLQIYPVEKTQLDQFLESGNFPESTETPSRKKNQTPPSKNSRALNYIPPFPGGRLFAVTGRNLKYDFENLVKMGWLEIEEVKDSRKKYYRKIQKFPPVERFNLSNTTANFITQPDFSTIADNYFQPLNDIQRFFMHIEYVVSKEAIDNIVMWQDELKKIWEKTPVSPVSIIYDSASLSREGKRVVYPVCIYYFQRAPYLCAFGQRPKKKQEIGWYNYRLDRIQAIEELSWDHPQIPELLKQKCLSKQPPSPDDIQVEMGKAWGFDFYHPNNKMLLRFERDFHDRYIMKSFRHDTFTFINAKANFKKFIREYPSTPSETEKLLEILESLPDDPNDNDYPHAYYSADYRVDELNGIDNNVMMRLRAWGPKVEILLPVELRERIAQDIQKTWNLYYS